ncbi:MAG: hypothetical protein AAB276_02385, partial [Pseudomonadota bacterium]
KLPSGKYLKQLMQSTNYKDGAFQNLSPTPMKPEDISYWKMMREFFKNGCLRLKPTWMLNLDLPSNLCMNVTINVNNLKTTIDKTTIKKCKIIHPNGTTIVKAIIDAKKATIQPIQMKNIYQDFMLFVIKCICVTGNTKHKLWGAVELKPDGEPYKCVMHDQKSAVTGPDTLTCDWKFLADGKMDANIINGKPNVIVHRTINVTAT